MKEKYITPEMDITLFECEDVITTSGGILANRTINEVRFLSSGYIDAIDDNMWDQQ